MISLSAVLIGIWAVLMILYGIIRGIVTLLGKTVFWSSIIVAILVVLYSWSRYGEFIQGPVLAIVLALITGIFAGAINCFIIHPLSKKIIEGLKSIEKIISPPYLEYESFFSATFLRTVGSFWSNSWEFAEKNYYDRIFHDED